MKEHILVKETGLVKDKGYLYYIKDGDIYRSGFKTQFPDVKNEFVMNIGVDVHDPLYLYFIGSDGNVYKILASRKGKAKKKPRKNAARVDA